MSDDLIRDWSGYRKEQWGVDALLLLCASEGAHPSVFTQRMVAAGFTPAMARAAQNELQRRKLLTWHHEPTGSTFEYNGKTFSRATIQMVLTDEGRAQLELMRAEDAARNG